MRASLLFLLAACAPDGTLDLLPRDGSADAITEACGTCPCGLTSCGGTCVDRAADPEHCGDCGRTCGHNQWCRQGACACLPGLTLCGQSCFDLTSDLDHCGGCASTPCAAGEKCESSACHGGPCTAARISCPSGTRTACVTKTVPFCNACGVTCAPNQVCTPTGCKRYKPATPCTMCPCTTDCARALSGSTCCSWLTGSICVEGTDCP